MRSLEAIIKTHRGGIGLTYGLTAVENIFELLYPFAIGLAINGLLDDQPLSLLPLLAIWLAHTTSGYLRQRYDTRLFARIFTTVASNTVIQQRGAGEPTSEIAARTDMVEELVEFLEHDVPAVVLAFFGLIGGAGMLLYYDVWAGLIMATLVLPATLIYLRFGRAAWRMEGRFNDRSEREVELIARAHDAAVRRHFRNLSRWRVRISDAEARSWSSVELIALVLFTAMLIRLSRIEGILAGDIFAAVAYAVLMLDAADALPERVASFSRMLDNLRRLG